MHWVSGGHTGELTEWRNQLLNARTVSLYDFTTVLQRNSLSSLASELLKLGKNRVASDNARYNGSTTQRQLHDLRSVLYERWFFLLVCFRIKKSDRWMIRETRISFLFSKFNDRFVNYIFDKCKRNWKTLEFFMIEFFLVGFMNSCFVSLCLALVFCFVAFHRHERGRRLFLFFIFISRGVRAANVYEASALLIVA